jgi:opacity protein-like surface antigen
MKKSITFYLAVFSISVAHSQEINALTTQWIGSLSAGPIWEQAGETQTFFLAPEIEKTYLANSNTHALTEGEVLIGLQKNFTRHWQSQLGLAVAHTSNAVLEGRIWDDADPSFDNFSYQYKVQHTRFTAKGKLIFNSNDWVMPWISGSAGLGVNQAKQFNNLPLIFEALPNTNFQSHTQCSFTYTLGVGLQKSFNAHLSAGLGYEFADWGKNSLGTAPDQTTTSTLQLNHLYTQGLQFNLTYLV